MQISDRAKALIEALHEPFSNERRWEIAEKYLTEERDSAVAAVYALHRKIPCTWADGFICECCYDEPDSGWPCVTIDAIQRAKEAEARKEARHALTEDDLAARIAQTRGQTEDV